LGDIEFFESTDIDRVLRLFNSLPACETAVVSGERVYRVRVADLR